MFRKWANQGLKDYLLRGYAINQRVARLEEKVAEHDKQIDFFVRTSRCLPPRGVFYDGQIFDAYVFVSDLIKCAKASIVLIDNYIDESVLMVLSKRAKNVEAKIITKHISPRWHWISKGTTSSIQPSKWRKTTAITTVFW